MLAPFAQEIEVVRAGAVIVSIALGAPFDAFARRFAEGGRPARGLMSLAALVVGVGAATAPTPAMIALGLVLGWTLLVLAAIDLRALRLPDLLTLPLAASGLAWNALGDRDPVGAAIGGLAGYASLVMVDAAYRALRGRSGIGRGDAKLFAAAGTWLGVAALPATLLLACGGALVLVVFGVVRRGRAALADPIAFGAPLAAAFWALWVTS